MRYPEWTPHRPGVYEEAADRGVGLAAVGSRGAGASSVCEAVEKILPDLNPHPARFARRPLPEGEGIFSLQFIRKGADEI